jgi:ferredoxin
MLRGIDMKDDKADIKEMCRICGRCVDVCPVNAITGAIKSVTAVQEVLDNIVGRVDYT